MNSTVAEVGRVLRIGRGWADVEIDNTVRRVNTRADLLVRAGNYLKVVGEQGVALIPASERHKSKHLH